MIKTHDTRAANRMLNRAVDLSSGRWLGVVPKSVALMNHCKCQNYGRNQFTYINRKRQHLNHIGAIVS